MLTESSVRAVRAEQCAIDPAQLRACVVSARHRRPRCGDLVPEHQDLDVLAHVGSGEQRQPAEHSGEHQVGELVRPQRRSCCVGRARDRRSPAGEGADQRPRRRSRHPQGGRVRPARPGCVGSPRSGSLGPCAAPGPRSALGWAGDVVGVVGRSSVGRPGGHASAAGSRRNEPQPAHTRWQQSAQRAEDGAVDPGQHRVRVVPTQHGDLMTEHQDLDVLGGIGSSEQR